MQDLDAFLIGPVAACKALPGLRKALLGCRQALLVPQLEEAPAHACMSEQTWQSSGMAGGLFMRPTTQPVRLLCIQPAETARSPKVSRGI